MFTHKNQQPNGRYERDACFCCLKRLGLGHRAIAELHGLKESTVAKLCNLKVGSRVTQPRYEGFDAAWVQCRALKSQQSKQRNRERNAYCPVANEAFKEERKKHLQNLRTYDKMYLDYHRKGFYGKKSNCPKYRQKKKLRAIVQNVWNGIASDKQSVRHLGCSVSVFTHHIEDQMEEGWTRDNYGKVWNFDHIRPCVEFDVFDPAQVKILNHYTNIRPICVVENAKLGAGLSKKSSFLPAQSSD